MADIVPDQPPDQRTDRRGFKEVTLPLRRYGDGGLHTLWPATLYWRGRIKYYCYPWKHEAVDMTHWSDTRVPSHTCTPSRTSDTCNSCSSCSSSIWQKIGNPEIKTRIGEIILDSLQVRETKNVVRYITSRGEAMN